MYLHWAVLWAKWSPDKVWHSHCAIPEVWGPSHSACAGFVSRQGFKKVVSNEYGVCTERLGRSHFYPWVVEKPAHVPNVSQWGWV